MKRLTIDEFRLCQDDFAAAVEKSPDISGFCSGSIWQLGGNDHIHGTRDPGRGHFIVREGNNWLVFAEDRPNTFVPLESSWMFGCPLIGHPGELPDLLHRAVARYRPDMVSIFFIAGIPEGKQLDLTMQDFLLETHCFHHHFDATHTVVIHLEDGFEGWLSRRSKKFRRTLRLVDSPSRLGITVEDARHQDTDTLYERILAIQRQTYKWQMQMDIFQSESYARFYRHLLEQTSRSGDLRLLFARQDGRDVAHIFGSLSGGRYRGFQMSYIEAVRHLGVGNALQIESIKRCIEENATIYDLGMPAPYKERWIDHCEINKGYLIAF